ncbi:PstS family phosphate ABC transporter substrate-binding protein [Actinoplanes sp. RD1]|uniref:PstS family phosphate ABC transporter substrate-binding protein n=1 Tax=Actinoplanes sp. RD1 TaxID=3064538 RepID=UPI0027410D28|nr:substrate-binding domain-containing protein [Actinoplanes sp. RD1]
MTLTLNTTIALLSVAVPALAFVWEFAVVRRKRLGYRVQMDSRASDTAHAPGAEVLRRIGANGDTQLRDPSFVLIRVENAGWMEIDETDYLAPADDPTGLRAVFRGRRVVGMALTEYSHDALVHFFTSGAQERPGFRREEHDGAGVLCLPKVKLNNGAYYKVMVVLARTAGDDGKEFEAPSFEADLLARRLRMPGRGPGLLARLRAGRTESHTFASRAALVLIGLLTTAVLAQSGLTLFGRQDPPPLDCVGGTLHLHGSTAFEPAVRRAAETYQRLCAAKGARIDATDFQGSGAGITALEAVGNDAGELGTAGVGNHLTFHDGEPEGPHPQLLARPVAYSLYTLVVNPDARVRTLTPAQIRDIYAGRITRWSDVKGADLPINLVNRSSTSGTRQALVERVLNGPGATTRVDVPPATTPDCAALGRDKPGSCEADSTRALLETVGEVPGALGMSEVSNAAGAEQVVQVRIGQVPATLAGVEDGRYPYWQTEIAYTYGELPADSIAAGFLRYLTDQGGKDILREFGNRPCSETEFPLVCEPA